ncbi:MAG: hypothetical protein P1V21_00235 [Rhizobiaceae bacterium]|nr:hypothetical protein [Rhizobiaceae bacterium]MDF2369201.1 hypothetical protein [Rhizobiaceae bacterium]|tara:strand:+ start:18909 stop:19109 length:201 start_codon:yes stop_codon:yes gene_type:complete
MANYRCDVCNMGVTLNCTDCNEPLVNDSITRDDGSSVQVSRCPKCEGKIKSPMCCGQDMTCTVAAA